MRGTLLVLIACLCVGSGSARARTVEVVSIGWHVGLAFAAEDLDPEGFPETADFPAARWIEIGWGDAGFYRDPDAGVAAMLSAAFASEGAVLHMVSMPAHPARYLPSARVVAVPLDDGQFDRLVGYVSGTVARAGRQRAQALGPGICPVSRFYPALGTFSLNRTCNSWVAQGLAVAGLPIDPEGVVRASTLMHRIEAMLENGSGPLPPQAPAASHR